MTPHPDQPDPWAARVERQHAEEVTRLKAQVAEGAGEYWPVVTTPEEALQWVREESNR